MPSDSPPAGWPLLRRLVRRHVLSTTLRGVGIFLGTIVVVSAAWALRDHYAIYNRDIRALASVLPDDPSWAQLVGHHIRRIEYVRLGYDTLARLLPCLLAGGLFVLVSLRRFALTARLQQRLCPTPRHRCAAFVLECIRYRLQGSAVWQFVVLLLSAATAFAIFAAANVRHITPQALSRGWLFALPLVAVPMVAAGASSARLRAMLARLKILDAYAGRFHRVRLAESALVGLAMAALVGGLILTLPALGRQGPQATARMGKVAVSQMDQYLASRYDQANPRNMRTYQTITALLTTPGESPELRRQRAMVRWQLYLPGLLLLNASLAAVALAGPLRPASRAGRWVRAAGILLAGAVGAAGAAALLRYLPTWDVGQVLATVGAVHLALLALLAVKALASAIRRASPCPHCRRSVGRHDRTCPTCGIRLDLARRRRPGGFLVAKGSRVVHHATCGQTIGARPDRWRSFATLGAALGSFGPDWPSTARPCKLCLGAEPLWAGDPVWVSRRRWLRWLAREWARPGEQTIEAELDEPGDASQQADSPEPQGQGDGQD